MDESSLPSPPLPPARTLRLASGRSLTIRDTGAPYGAEVSRRPPLVLLHGWTATADLNWFLAYGALARSFRVLAWDQRGHGHGIRSRRPFRIEDCADDVAEVLDACGIGQAIVVGYSMGGAIAQMFVHRHPARAAGVVLCATSRRFASSTTRERAFWNGLIGLSFAARMIPNELRGRAAGAIIGSRLAGSPLEEWAARELRSSDGAVILQAGAALGRFDSRPWLGQFDLPAAVVVTTLDRLIDPSRQLALAESIPGARVYRVASDHAACVVAAGRFVPALFEACTHVASRHPKVRLNAFG